MQLPAMHDAHDDASERLAIYRAYLEGRLDADRATARLLALDLPGQATERGRSNQPVQQRRAA